MTSVVSRRLALVKRADLIIEVTGCEEFASLSIDYRAKCQKPSLCFAPIHVSVEQRDRSERTRRLGQSAID